ncbi:MAG: hypothetical protein ACR2O3_10180 [Rhizobiaceae bacterium]
MFEIFAYFFCFAAGFGLAVFFMVLTPYDTWLNSYDPDSEESRAADREISKHWKTFGFMGGLSAMIYYGAAPRDPLLHSLLSAIWRFLGGN